MKNSPVFFVLVLASLFLSGCSLFSSSKNQETLIPEVNDQLAWNILQNATYPNPHIPSGSVTLVDG